MADFQAPSINFTMPAWADEDIRQELEKVAGLACHLAGALACDWSDVESSLERLMNAVEEIGEVAAEFGGGI